MRILDYPRPAGDTGIGFHWYPDMYHYAQTDFNLFVPKLKSLGASWLTVLSEVSKPVPETFIKGLVANGIEPVIRIYTPKIISIDQTALRTLCQTYAAWGAHYIHVHNEPNLEGEWASWNTSELVSRFMDIVTPCLETMYGVSDVIPVLTPLAPGGNYRDIVFFREMLDALIARGKTYLFSKLAVCLHNYALNHPLDWGKGGQTAWPCAQDNSTPPGCQDSNGFRQFEWYDEIVRAKVGFSLPMICGENGALPGSHQDTNFPAIDATLHAQRHVEMSRLLMVNEVPYYIFNNAFWILTATDHSMFAGQRWYRDTGDPILTESIQALQSLPKQPRPLNPNFQIPGTIRVLMPDKTVRVMQIEEYLRGVVPAEMPASSPIEALKAQAIAARSYAVTSKRHDAEGADICTTTHCQVWAAATNQSSDKAVLETAGRVAVYGDRVIRSFYFAACDGHTRNSEDVWVEKLPYCRSVTCAKPAQMKGHGVGMCQTGAIAMAQQGATALAILQHYYTGVKIINAEAETPPEARRSVIKGTVRDQNSNGRGGVTLILRQDDWNGQTTSTATGQYQFTGLAAGTYSVEISGTNLRQDNIRLDGQNYAMIDFILPVAFGWEMDVRRQPGLRLLVGIMPRAGIPVTISNNWGHSVTVISGSKKEYGPGGWECPIWVTGQYTIRFLSQEFRVEVREETVFVTFREAGEAQTNTRLISDWMPLADAQALLQKVEARAAFKGWFTLEQGTTAAATAWTMEVTRQAGLRLLIGRLPRPGIAVQLTDQWGNRVNLTSGSKPEYGPGAWESPVWRDGVFTIRFEDQTFSVEVRSETVFVTFRQVQITQSRLASAWLTAAIAADRLAKLQADPELANAFKTEKRS